MSLRNQQTGDIQTAVKGSVSLLEAAIKTMDTDLKHAKENLGKLEKSGGDPQKLTAERNNITYLETAIQRAETAVKKGNDAVNTLSIVQESIKLAKLQDQSTFGADVLAIEKLPTPPTEPSIPQGRYGSYHTSPQALQPAVKELLGENPSDLFKLAVKNHLETVTPTVGVYRNACSFMRSMGMEIFNDATLKIAKNIEKILTEDEGLFKLAADSVNIKSATAEDFNKQPLLKLKEAFIAALSSPVVGAGLSNIAQFLTETTQDLLSNSEGYSNSMFQAFNSITLLGASSLVGTAAANALPKSLEGFTTDRALHAQIMNERPNFTFEQVLDYAASYKEQVKKEGPGADATAVMAKVLSGPPSVTMTDVDKAQLKTYAAKMATLGVLMKIANFGDADLIAAYRQNADINTLFTKPSERK